MSDFRTKLTCSGTGRIVEKFDVIDTGGSKSITLTVSFARRRNESGSGNVICEDDLFPIKFWATGAEIINDTAFVGDYINLDLEVRSVNGKPQLKAKHFDILKGS
jgi:hypothetical protein